MVDAEVEQAVAVGSTTRVADGIWRIVVPTPFPVGPVNVYVIDDEPLTLLDTGPVSPDARRAVEDGLLAIGRRVSELGRVIVSHQHVDHWGMAAELARRSGAEIVALAPFGEWLGRYPASFQAEDRFAAALLVRHGIDPESRTAGVYRGDLTFGARVEVSRPVHDGDVLEFADRTLRVLHRPGHSRSDTAFHDEARGVMLGADHVMLKPVVSILSPPLDGSVSRRRARPMADARTSLTRTAAMELDRVLPGHGAVVADHRAVVASHLRRLDRMRDRVQAAVTAEPRPAIEIARAVRGRVADYAAFFVLCDTLGCLDELLDAGAVVETEADGVARFHRP